MERHLPAARSGHHHRWSVNHRTRFALRLCYTSRVCTRHFRGLLGALTLVALGARPGTPAAVEFTHITPWPQPPLVVLSDSVGEVRTAFNAAADRPRVLLMLSPT